MRRFVVDAPVCCTIDNVLSGSSKYVIASVPD